jgi:hypothetical protein
MPKRGGSGRRLTYSERWGYLADWVASFAVSEHNLGAREMAQDTLDYMDNLVKARPVRPKARRLTRKGRMAHAGNR